MCACFQGVRPPNHRTKELIFMSNRSPLDVSQVRIPPPSRARRPRFARAILLLLVLGLAAWLPAGCGRDDEAGQGPHGSAAAGAQPAAGAAHGGQRPGAGQPGMPGQRPERPPTPVSVATATRGDIASYYDATATLEAERQAEILSRVAGVVETLHCEEGDRVAADAPLLVVDNDEYLFRLRQAEATTANLRSRFERMEQMRQEELASEEEYQASKSELASAEADEGMARLNWSYTTVLAPFAGRITQRMVDVGQNVSVGDPLFVVADFDPLLARVHVPSKEFRRLSRDQEVTLVLDSGGEKLAGRIKLVSPIIDPQSGTIKLTVEIPSYPDGVRPGDFAAVRIVTERRTGTVLVPKIAVVTEKGETVVYTSEDDVAVRKPVTVGFMDDENAEIVAGLSAGELVVVRGQRSLEHGAPLRILQPESALAAGGSGGD
jgi:membrane fusion protein (multidrug efflux system)